MEKLRLVIDTFISSNIPCGSYLKYETTITVIVSFLAVTVMQTSHRIDPCPFWACLHFSQEKIIFRKSKFIKKNLKK